MELKCSVGRGQFFKAQESLEVDRRKPGTGLEMQLFSFCGKKKKKKKDHNMEVEHFEVLRLILFQNLRLFLFQWLFKSYS